MAKVYTDKDADLSVFKGKTLAVLGFGSQGHAHALNLKESGCNVIIGLYEGSKSIKVAREKGFEVLASAETRRSVRRWEAAQKETAGHPNRKAGGVFPEVGISRRPGHP